MEGIQDEEAQEDLMPEFNKDAFVDDPDSEKKSSRRRIVGPRGHGLNSVRRFSSNQEMIGQNPWTGPREYPGGKQPSSVHRYQRTRATPYARDYGRLGRSHARSFFRGNEQRSIPCYDDLDKVNDEDYEDPDDEDAVHANFQNLKGDARCVVEFSNLGSHVRDSAVKDICSVYGETVTCRVTYDDYSGVHTGQAFAEFFRAEDASRAVRACAGKILNGRPLMCSLLSNNQTENGTSGRRASERLADMSSSFRRPYIGSRSPMNGAGGRPQARVFEEAHLNNAKAAHERGPSFSRSRGPEQKQGVTGAQLDQELENYWKNDAVMGSSTA